MLQGFTDKDMIEQITVLDDVKQAGRVDLIPALMELYANPLSDQAVDEIVYYTLYELAAGQPQAVAEGLKHSSSRVQVLFVRRAGEDGGVALQDPLIELLNNTEDVEMVAEVVRALGGFDDPALVEVIVPFLEADNDTVVAWAMHSLVALKVESGRLALHDVVEKSADSCLGEGGCGLKTAQAISCVASYKDSRAAEFLVAYIHHPLACFRRVVVRSLSEIGEDVLPVMEKCLLTGDKDEKIMAANIVGWTGLRKGADLLNSLLDQQGSLDSNLKFAIYEAMGRIPSMRSFTCLADGLREQDELVLMAVVTGLNDLCNPGIIKALGEMLDQGDAQSKLVMRTMVTGRTAKLFEAVYSGGRHGSTLIDEIAASGDAEATNFFRAILEKTDAEGAQADAERLVKVETSTQNGRFVAADDSKAMLFFYRGVAADLGVELVCRADGKEAFDYLKSATDIDLLITDMNMPNMDGIELTRELRNLPQWSKLPILMATTESEKAQADQAREAGVDNFISKPFSKEDLKAKLKTILG